MAITVKSSRKFPVFGSIKIDDYLCETSVNRAYFTDAYEKLQSHMPGASGHPSFVLSSILTLILPSESRDLSLILNSVT